MMKLFSFWRKASTAAPVTIVPLPSEATAVTPPAVSLLPLLVLKVVQAFPNRGEERAMRRFFEKTSITDSEVLQCWHQLFERGLLQAGALKQGVQYFVPSERGLAHLEEHYDQEAMLGYVMELEPKGFIATLLRNIANRQQ